MTLLKLKFKSQKINWSLRINKKINKSQQYMCIKPAHCTLFKKCIQAKYM